MPPVVPPTRRSRNGCIDCRRAKVKCDEIRPSCGTCARRRLVCQGYKTPAAHSKSPTSSLLPAGGKMARKETWPVSSGSKTSATETNAVAAPVRSGSGPASPSSPFDSPRALALLPPGTVPLADEAHIEVYFNRHPFELLIGNEFVSEMNANVLMMLQQDPGTVADAISAIGYSYLVGDSAASLLPVLNRRARILANLRNMKPSSYYFEEALFLLLGLCAMELVTLAQPGQHATIPTVLANVASLIGHHVSTGGNVSSVARYFLRALARQDLVVSLVHLRRPRVPTCIWLDNACHKPDRLLGYTVTLMPLLEELCTLADQVRERILQPAPPGNLLLDTASAQTSSAASSTTTTSPPPSACLDTRLLGAEYSSTASRAESLRARLESWKPSISDNLPFRASRKFRAQAACYRAGALLYLHRLFHPPGRGAATADADADAEALGRAHDVMLYTSGPPAESKMLLWPVFLAACEMADGEDRAAVQEVLDSIAAHRKTVTVERTRRFVAERVWKARDERSEWNWMVLAQRYPGECLPI